MQGWPGRIGEACTKAVTGAWRKLRVDDEALVAQLGLFNHRISPAGRCLYCFLYPAG